MKPLRWGILSTGRIAGIFAEALSRSRTGFAAAVGSRSRDSAEAFARRHRIPAAHGNYRALLEDPAVEAVYVAPPHPLHAEWTLRALAAGKHVLCEKPLAMDARSAARMVAAARQRGLFLMEAFMYRCHPQTARLASLVREGLAGPVRLIQASFCFDAPLDPGHRLFNRRLGGGGILDVGCYPVSMARLLAGAALGKPFADPVRVRGVARIGGKSRVDEAALAGLEFPGGILAELSCSIRLDRGTSRVAVVGSRGTLTAPSPWFAKRGGGTSHLLFQKNGEKKIRKIPVSCPQSLYVLEADAAASCIRKGLVECPAMSWSDSLGNMRVLDLWRKSAGMRP
jgi:predicted dehydrogenase